MKQYLDLCQEILNNGILKKTVPVLAPIIFSYQMRFNLAAGSLLN